ncbi:hypothetical protein M885DRAFT_611972 [Pelagophyceae sp. CCMP2097]|nr:hypothetical protein M885DRAFT_611972 [Pelagophyceae sp. CCMP2097]
MADADAPPASQGRGGRGQPWLNRGNNGEAEADGGRGKCGGRGRGRGRGAAARGPAAADGDAADAPAAEAKKKARPQRRQNTDRDGDDDGDAAAPPPARQQRLRQPRQPAAEGDDSADAAPPPPRQQQQPKAKAKPAAAKPAAAGGKPAARKAEPARRPAGRAQWWRSLTDCDPISLEPLNELEYPPFEIIVGCDSKHYFDGRILAFYVVSTGTFINPMSRAPLTQDDCKRLDHYLHDCGLDEARVEDAYRLQQSIKAPANSDGDAPNAAQQQVQRRHATAVLHSLFGFARYGDSASSHRGARPQSGGRALRTAYDDSDDERAARGGASSDEEAEEKEEEEAFPTLDGGDAATAARGFGWTRAPSSRGGVLHSGQLDLVNDFPSFGDAPRRAAAAAPRFRDAVVPFRASLHAARGNDTSRDAALAAAAAACHDDAFSAAEQFPGLPGGTGAAQRRLAIAAQYAAMARAPRPEARAEPAAQRSAEFKATGMTKRERERANRREREREALEAERAVALVAAATDESSPPVASAAGGSVVQRIRQVAGDAALGELRQRSLQFRHGAITANEFYDAAAALIPPPFFESLFRGLVQVLPDPRGQAELEALIDARRRPAATAAPPAAAAPPRAASPPPQPVVPQPETRRERELRGRHGPVASDFPTMAPTRAAPAAAANKGAKAPQGWAADLKRMGVITKAKGRGIGIAVAVQKVKPRAAAQPQSLDLSAPPEARGAAPAAPPSSARLPCSRRATYSRGPLEPMAAYRPSYDQLYVHEGGKACLYARAASGARRLEGALWKLKAANMLMRKAARWKLMWVLVDGDFISYFSQDAEPPHGTNPRKRIPLASVELRTVSVAESNRRGIDLVCAEQAYTLHLALDEDDVQVWTDFLGPAIERAKKAAAAKR